jgi:Protein of unknown function (DUF1778)
MGFAALNAGYTHSHAQRRALDKVRQEATIMMVRRSQQEQASRVRRKRRGARDSSGPIIPLNAEDSRAFAEALLNPREPNDRLRAAARRYREMINS